MCTAWAPAAGALFRRAPLLPSLSSPRGDCPLRPPAASPDWRTVCSPTDLQRFYAENDPEKENLCLYGLEDGTWKVSLPEEEVPPELPEPSLGINFARDGMQRLDWLRLVAVHSDAWLVAVAFYRATRLNKAEKAKLFELMNDYPSVHEVLHGATDPVHGGMRGGGGGSSGGAKGGVGGGGSGKVSAGRAGAKAGARKASGSGGGGKRARSDDGTAVIGWPPAPGERIEVHWELNDDEGGSTRTRSVWWGCVVVGPTAGGVQLMYEEAHGFSAEAAVVRFQSAAELVDLSSGDTQKWRRRN